MNLKSKLLYPSYILACLLSVTLAAPCLGYEITVNELRVIDEYKSNKIDEVYVVATFGDTIICPIHLLARVKSGDVQTLNYVIDIPDDVAEDVYL